MVKYLIRALRVACCLFTVLTLTFYLFGYIVSAAKLPAMTGTMIAALFLYSLMLGLASGLLSAPRPAAWLRYLLHLLLSVGGFLLVYRAVLGQGETGAKIVVCLVLALIVYGIVMFGRALIRSQIEKRKER